MEGDDLLLVVPGCNQYPALRASISTSSSVSSFCSTPTLRSLPTQRIEGKRTRCLQEFGFPTLFIKEQWAPCQLWWAGKGDEGRREKATAVWSYELSV